MERSRQTTGRVSAPHKKSFQIVHVCLKSFGHTAERPPPKRPSAGPITTHAIGAASATIAAHPPRLNPPSQCYDGRRRAPQAAGGRHERQGGQNSGQEDEAVSVEAEAEAIVVVEPMSAVEDEVAQAPSPVEMP